MLKRGKKSGFLIAVAVMFVAAIAMLCLSGCLFDKDKDGDKGDGGGSALDLAECEAWASCIDNTYNGQPHYAGIVIKKDDKYVTSIDKNGTHDDLETEYRDNVNAGTAKVKVKAKSGSTKFSGETETTFYINRATALTADAAELISMAASGNYRTVWLSADTELAYGQTLVISAGTTVDLNGFRLTSKGKIENSGTIAVEPGKGSRSELYLSGETENFGKITLSGSSMIQNGGNLTNSGEIKLSDTFAKIYTDSPIEGNGTISNPASIFERVSLNELEITLSYDRVNYDGEKKKPAVTVKNEGQIISENGNYLLTYADNTNAGTADVTLTALDTSQEICGERTVHFAIDKGTVTVTDQRKLHEAVANANWGTVIAENVWIDTFITSDALVVPEGMTLEMRGGSLAENKTLAVEGTLVAKLNPNAYGNAALPKFYGKIDNGGRVEVHSDNSAVFAGELAGAGVYENIGKAFFEDTATFSAGTVFKNLAKAFSNAEVAGIRNEGDGTFILRREISEEYVKLDRTEFVYDGTSKYAYPVFEGLQIAQDTYYVERKYYNGFASTGESVLFKTDAGTVALTLEFNENSEHFFGKITLDYEIVPGETTVNYDYEFTNAYNSGNYAKITLNNHFCLSEKEPFTIRQGVEVVVSAGRKAYAEKQLTVNGKLTVDGVYSENNQKVIIGTGGEIVINGTAYFNDSIPVGVTDNGTVHIRRPISEAEWIDFEEEVTYVKGHNSPEIALRFNGEDLVPRTDFRKGYSCNASISVDDKKAIAIATAEKYSEKVWGSAEMEYTILAGSVRVSDFESLKSALENLADGGELCNYKDIYIEADITTTMDKTEDIYIYIQPNTTLHVGSHSVTVNKKDMFSKYIHFVLKDGAKVIAERTPWIHGNCYLDNETTN